LKKIIWTALFLLAAASCTGQPKIQFESLNFDFGDVEIGDDLTHVFIFKNTGTGTLIIENVKSG